MAAEYMCLQMPTVSATVLAQLLGTEEPVQARAPKRTYTDAFVIDLTQ